MPLRCYAHLHLHDEKTIVKALKMPDLLKSHLQAIMNYTGSEEEYLNFKRCILFRSHIHTTPHFNDLIRLFSHAMNCCVCMLGTKLH